MGIRFGRSAAVIAAVALLAGPAAATAATPTWTKVGTGLTGNISGVAPGVSGWVIVRDNKAAGQNRISLLSDTDVVTALTWPGTAPKDLESVAAVPGVSGDYAALTSSGTGSLFAISGTTVTVVSQFTVPRGTSNVESFALTQVGSAVVAVWATRGSTTAPANVFAATFTPSTGVFGRVATAKVSVPYPDSDLRQVTDLAIVNANLVGSAASDPGDSGPFDSALYNLGSVTVSAGRVALTITTPTSLGSYGGHKIEGVACSGTTGLLGSDDEKLGGWVRTDGFCG
jgi:hypothetical protein